MLCQLFSKETRLLFLPFVGYFELIELHRCAREICSLVRQNCERVYVHVGCQWWQDQGTLQFWWQLQSFVTFKWNPWAFHRRPSKKERTRREGSLRLRRVALPADTRRNYSVDCRPRYWVEHKDRFLSAFQILYFSLLLFVVDHCRRCCLFLPIDTTTMDCWRWYLIDRRALLKPMSYKPLTVLAALVTYPFRLMMFYSYRNSCLLFFSRLASSGDLPCNVRLFEMKK